MDAIYNRKTGETLVLLKLTSGGATRCLVTRDGTVMTADAMGFFVPHTDGPTPLTKSEIAEARRKAEVARYAAEADKSR